MSVFCISSELRMGFLWFLEAQTLAAFPRPDPSGTAIGLPISWAAKTLQSHGVFCMWFSSIQSTRVSPPHQVGTVMRAEVP